MTARAAIGGAKRAHAVVLVFGESINDARAVAFLIEALCPILKGRVRPLPRPTSLQRSASEPRAVAWMRQLRGVVDAYRQPVACVFVHRDTDSPDPLGALEDETQKRLMDAGIENAHAVVPVAEIEAWWLLFASATETLRASWSGTLPKAPRSVDVISDPKRELIRRTGRNDARKAYSEADSPLVADRVAAAIAAGEFPSGSSRSFSRFTTSVDACCRTA